MKFYKLGIICGILHQEYLKMRIKKLNIFKDIKLKVFNSIETFFRFTKIWYFIYALTWPDSLKIVLSGRIRHLKKIILKGRGFRGGSDEKMRRMWLGREIVVVSHPALLQLCLETLIFLKKSIPLNLVILNLAKNIPLLLSSSQIIVWAKSVKWMSYNRINR